jgi:hypothetical protein
MKDNYFYFAAVLDRSGSMGENGKIEEARKGFNEFIKDKKSKNYLADITLTIFDDQIDTLYSGNLQGCPDLTEQNFSPRGMTALYDAIGKTVIEIGKILSSKSEEERPSKVIVTIITDGLENVSKEFSSTRIGEIIKEQQEKYSWEFLFMGADENSIINAQQINIPKGNTTLYANNSVGVQTAYRGYSKSIDKLTGN